MNREIADLREVVTKLVPMLTNKGLKVTQRGSRAYVQANAKTNKPELVNIPSIPDNAGSEFIAAIGGFIDHEVGHVLFTDWKFYGGDGIALDKFSPEGRALTNAHNIVEDTFVEREIVKVFPGSRSNLEQLHDHFIKRITTPALQQVKGDVKQEFGILFVPMIRALSGQQIFQDFMDDNGHWNHPMINNINLALSKETLALIQNARNTRETLQAAQEIHDILFNRPEEPQEPEQPEEPEQTPPPPPAEPDDGESDGESQDKPDQEAGEGDGDGERDHSESEPSDDDAEGDDEGQGGKGEEPDDEGQAEDETDGDEAGDGDGQDMAPQDGEGDDTAGGDGDQPEDDDDGEESDAGGSGRAGKPAAQDDAGEDDEEGDASDNGDADGGEDGGSEDGDGDDAGSADAGGDDDDNDPDGHDGDTADEDGDDTGEADGQDGGDEEAEGADAWDDHEGGDSGSDEVNASEDDAGFGGNSGKSMFDLDPSEFAPVDLSQAIQNQITQMAALSLDEADYTVFTKDEDKIEIFDPEKLKIVVSDEWVPRMEEKVQGMVGKMQKDIERALASQSHVIRTPGHKRGRLHAPSLFRVPQNDPRVFTQKEEVLAKNTAVGLLIDNSGSMHGRELDVAMHAAYALVQTLDRVNIPSEVMGFTTGNLSRSAIDALSADPMRHSFSRTSTIVMPVFKEFSERLTPLVKRRFAAQINVQAGCNLNIDGESLEYAAYRLLKRTEKRKVLLVMSDGNPVGPGTGFHLRQTVEKLGKMGVETVGMGILTDVVKNFYPRHMVLNEIADLPAVVMGELRRILMS